MESQTCINLSEDMLFPFISFIATGTYLFRRLTNTERSRTLTSTPAEKRSHGIPFPKWLVHKLVITLGKSKCSNSHTMNFYFSFLSLNDNHNFNLFNYDTSLTNTFFSPFCRDEVTLNSTWRDCPQC